MRSGCGSGKVCPIKIGLFSLRVSSIRPETALAVVLNKNF